MIIIILHCLLVEVIVKQQENQPSLTQSYQFGQSGPRSTSA